jgi:predicted ATPase
LPRNRAAIFLDLPEQAQYAQKQGAITMNSIKTLSISGFKSIREMKELELRPLNVLIGANGAGKSNLVSFFRMVNLMMKNALFEYVMKSGNADTILYNGEKITSHIEAGIAMSINDEDNAYQFMLCPYNNLLGIKNEIVKWQKHEGDTEAPGIEFGTLDGTKSSSLADLRKQGRYPRIVPVWNYLFKLGVFQFNDTTYTSKIRKQCLVDDNKAIFEDGGNFPAMLYYLRKQHLNAYLSIIDTIRLVYSSFDDFILEPYRNNRDYLDWRWKENGSSYEFRPYQLSDGTLRFMALATLLKLPPEDMPSLVIIDEPELGLHPAAIGVLADLLKSASKKTQIIVSTQSVSLVNYINVEDVIVVEKEDDQSVFKHLNRSELSSWLEDFTLGELWEKNVIGGRP